MKRVKMKNHIHKYFINYIVDKYKRGVEKCRFSKK